MQNNPQTTQDFGPPLVTVFSPPPERIWLLLREGSTLPSYWYANHHPERIESAEYIRADVVKTMIDAASAAAGVRDDD